MDMTFPQRNTVTRHSESKSRLDWLIHFRKAKCEETLTHMAERLWDSLTCKTNRLNMWLAYGDRQDEIEQHKFTRRHH
ncbi:MULTISPECIES: hypothetical protein [Aeromonas]|uniref:hypothetical protein n=1 Tax=Aeromonas TaxID=642 RepID=UPI002E1C15AB